MEHHEIECPYCGAPGIEEVYEAGTQGGRPVWRSSIDCICGYAVDGLGNVTNDCPECDN